MLRIHFSAADLVRTRVETRLDPMWELVLSVHQVARPVSYFGGWNRLARQRLGEAGLMRDAELLATLTPARGYFPDFLTPASRTAEFEAGVETVLSTDKRRLRAEVGRLDGGRGAGPWLDDVAAGRPAALHRLGVAMRRYHRAVVAPHVDQASEITGRWVTGLAHRALAHGLDAVLSKLGPTTRWRAPVLEIDYPETRDLHLEGRGLTLVPTFFGVNHPISLADPRLQPVLVYPVSREPFWQPGRGLDEPARPDTLSELLGETRAAVLRLLDTELTTTALAALTTTSLSSVSRHTAVLRRAGLITTRRSGTRVLHLRTVMGNGLVHGR